MARILKQPSASDFALQPALGQTPQYRQRRGWTAAVRGQNQQPLIAQAGYQTDQSSHPLRAGHFINLTI